MVNACTRSHCARPTVAKENVMRATQHIRVLFRIGLGLLLVAGFAIGCGDDSPTGLDPDPTPTGSNMSFDKLGVAVIPGGTAMVGVNPLAGDLEPFTVSSSDEGVATATGSSMTRQATAAVPAGMITVTGVGHGSATITVSTDSGDEREFPVTVYDNTVLDAGELLIKFTDEFGARFNDSGSGADDDGDFYHPIAPAGYHALGSIGFSGYQNPGDLRTAVMVVKDKGLSPENPPLKAPVDYEIVWHNGIYLFNSWLADGNDTGAFWRPVPPEGYVALGLVIHNWTMQTTAPYVQKPLLNAVMCVREDLTRTASIGGYIWRDAGNGLSDRNFRSDQLVIPEIYNDYEQMHLAPGTFVGHASQAKNTTSNPDASVLCLDPQILIDADYSSTLWRPELNSLEDPGNATQPLRNRTVLVPFTAFADAGRDIYWKVENSPFYVLERNYYWEEECFTSGLGGCTVSYTTGSTESNEKTTWETEGVTSSWEVGFSIKGIGGKMSTTVTKTLGFAESIGVSEFEEKTVSTEVPAPGEGAVLATWKAANRFRLYRHNAGALEVVVSPWTMFEDAFHSSRYP
jgi:hypothetical protein